MKNVFVNKKFLLGLAAAVVTSVIAVVVVKAKTAQDEPDAEV